MSRYFAIGDSQCLYSTYHLPRFIQHTTGSTYMREIADGTTKLDLPGWGVQPGDKVFFFYGGIDVRCDTHNQIAAGGDEVEIIAELVSRYIEVLRQNEIPGVEFWQVSLLPPPYYLGMPVEIRDHPIYPFIGTDAEIARYTKQMNAELFIQGMKRGYEYLDIHRRYADASGMMTPALGACMHVDTNAPVAAELHARGLYTDEEAKQIPDLGKMLKDIREGAAA